MNFLKKFSKKYKLVKFCRKLMSVTVSQDFILKALKQEVTHYVPSSLTAVL